MIDSPDDDSVSSSEESSPDTSTQAEDDPSSTDSSEPRDDEEALNEIGANPLPSTDSDEESSGRQSTEEMKDDARTARDQYQEEVFKGSLFLLRSRLATLRQDRSERKRYSERIFALLSVWLLTVLLILAVSGIEGSIPELRLNVTLWDIFLLSTPGLFGGGLVFLHRLKNCFCRIAQSYGWKWAEWGSITKAQPSSSVAQGGDETRGEGEVADQDAKDDLGELKAIISKYIDDVDDGRTPILQTCMTLFRVTLLVSPFLIATAVLVDVSVSDFRFHLSDSVLNTLLTTTTVNVIGLFSTVTLYLFFREKQSLLKNIPDTADSFLPSFYKENSKE